MVEGAREDVNRRGPGNRAAHRHGGVGSRHGSGDVNRSVSRRAHGEHGPESVHRRPAEAGSSHCVAVDVLSLTVQHDPARHGHIGRGWVDRHGRRHAGPDETEPVDAARLVAHDEVPVRQRDGRRTAARRQRELLQQRARGSLPRVQVPVPRAHEHGPVVVRGRGPDGSARDEIVPDDGARVHVQGHHVSAEEVKGERPEHDEPFGDHGGRGVDERSESRGRPDQGSGERIQRVHRPGPVAHVDDAAGDRGGRDDVGGQGRLPDQAAREGVKSHDVAGAVRSVHHAGPVRGPLVDGGCHGVRPHGCAGQRVVRVDRIPEEIIPVDVARGDCNRRRGPEREPDVRIGAPDERSGRFIDRKDRDRRRGVRDEGGVHEPVGDGGSPRDPSGVPERDRPLDFAGPEIGGDEVPLHLLEEDGVTGDHRRRPSFFEAAGRGGPPRCEVHFERHGVNPAALPIVMELGPFR